MTSDCTEATEVYLGASTVDIRASTFLIGRVNSPTSTDVEVNVRVSTVDIEALTVDQSSVPLLYLFVVCVYVVCVCSVCMCVFFMCSMCVLYVVVCVSVYTFSYKLVKKWLIGIDWYYLNFFLNPSGAKIF